MLHFSWSILRVAHHHQTRILFIPIAHPQLGGHDRGRQGPGDRGHGALPKIIVPPGAAIPVVLLT